MIVETHDEQGFAEPWCNNFYTFMYYNNNGNEETIKEELAKENAKYLDSGELEFDTEQDYVMFVLKWI